MAQICAQSSVGMCVLYRLFLHETYDMAGARQLCNLRKPLLLSSSLLTLKIFFQHNNKACCYRKHRQPKSRAVLCATFFLSFDSNICYPKLYHLKTIQQMRYGHYGNFRRLSLLDTHCPQLKEVYGVKIKNEHKIEFMLSNKHKLSKIFLSLFHKVMSSQFFFQNYKFQPKAQAGLILK